jgi:hypothetical protein
MDARFSHREPVSQTRQGASVESRLTPIIAILAILVLVEALPARYQLMPGWFPYLAGVLIIGSMVAVMVAPASGLFTAAERWIMFFFCGLIVLIQTVDISRLAGDMITHHHDYASVTLLESAVEIWFVNIIVFAVIYWQLDSGGPESRVAAAGTPDFIFKEAEHWGPRSTAGKPNFIDYLFLAFTVATSFTAAEPRPLTSRAQLLMMLEALISLTTLFVVAARAIATLS